MRILLLNQFFWPDAAATSQLLTDVARGLRARGHEVHAISADRGYAIEDSTDRPDVVMHRVKSARFMRGSIGRMASYASFFIGCAWKGLRVPRPDVVVTLTTPPLLSLIGNIIRIFRGSRHFIWEMDMYPDVAVDLGYVVPGGVVDRLVGGVADLSRHHSDGILALGECMRDRLTRRGVPASRISIAENWADSKLIAPAPWPEPTTPFTVLYSGNFGLAHDVETISEVMGKLRNDEGFRFVFAGSGARREELEKFCQEQAVSNAEFRPYSSKASLGESLGYGHVGLITQQDACLGSVVPSKVYGLLAAGRPVLFVGPKKSTVAQIIGRFQCGWQVECGDSASLLALLEYLKEHRAQVEAAGARARKALLEHYDRPHGVSRICTLIGAFPQIEALQIHEGTAPDSLVSKGKRLANIR